jgi:hypothetical protein
VKISKLEWLITAKKGRVPERAIETEKDNYARSKGRLSFFIAMPGRKCANGYKTALSRCFFIPCLFKD